jgi:uncharacterized protein (TIGR02246 family)
MKGEQMRKSAILSVICCSLLVAGFGTLSADGPTDLRAVEGLGKRWENAWNRHDMEALSAVVGEDVDFITVGGRWLKTRTEFRKYHAQRHEVVFKQSTWTTTKTEVKFVRPDVAVAHVQWSLKGDRNDDATPREPRDGIFTWVVEKKSGDWLIVAAQNTNLTFTTR